MGGETVPMESSSVSKIIVIGLDGATWSLLQPWIDAGQLPNLAALQARGAWGKLASTIQPLSAPAWTSFLTGMNQGKHGIFDFVRRKAGSYGLELTNSTMIGAPTLFEYFGQAGLRVASVNVPFTFPVWPINGVMIGGPFAPDMGPRTVYPSHLWKEFSCAVPDYRILPDYVPGAANPEGRLAADLVTCVHNRTLAAEFLLAREDWDVFIVVYTSTDQVQHAFWHYLPDELGGTDSGKASPPLREAILSVYREVDEGVGRILCHATDDTLVVVLSDHGAGRLDWWVHLNRWLAQQGYLVYQSRARAIWQSSHSRFTATLMRAYGLLVPQVARQGVRHVLGARFQTLKEQVETSLLMASIDWPRTRAYALGSGDIYVNLKGREPDGTVAPGDEYDTLRDEISTALENLTSPDGKLIVERVYRREELYDGPCARLGADLTVVMTDHLFHSIARYATPKSLFENPNHWRFDARPLTGGHRPDGVLLLSKGPICPGVGLRGARIVDLAPTMLAAIGLPVPSEMDGRALQEAFETPLHVSARMDGGVGTGQEPAGFEGYTVEEEARIESRLTDLGYL